MLIALGVVLVLEQWGYNVSALVAGLGIGGLAIALAAQDTLANLFGFTTIAGDRPLVVGEYIVTPDVEGIVEYVGLRSTWIRQLNQALVVVPNATLAGSVITNWSRLNKRQMQSVLTLEYDTTAPQMQRFLEAMRGMLRARPLIDPDSVVVLFTEFSDSALEVLVRCYVHESDWVAFHQEKERVNLEIMNLMATHGLSFAFPSRSIYIENMPPLSPAGFAPPRPPRPLRHQWPAHPRVTSRATSATIFQTTTTRAWKRIASGSCYIRRPWSDSPTQGVPPGRR
ncbi:MAG: mechanosensitive ion channel family protein [Anaerolineae bacterium]|nr:mechanosensitive ion channel family protein [Anaerolineae bacterium]